MKNMKKTGGSFRRHGWSVIMALLLIPMLAFAQYKTYILNDGNGITDPDGLETSSAFPIVATPNSGYEFDVWNDNGGIVDDTSRTNSFILLLSPATNVVTAKFKAIIPILTADHTGNGSITVAGTPNSTTYTATYNETVSLVAVPDANSTFFGWSGDISGTNMSTNIVMTSDMTVSANFILRPQLDFIISSLNDDGVPVGDPLPSAGLHRYDYDELISAHVDTEWLVNAGERAYEDGFVGTGSTPATGHQDTLSFSITTNSTVTFNWRTDYKVTVHVSSSNGQSAVSRNLPGWDVYPLLPADTESRWHEKGTTVMLTAVPGGGERFQGWSGSGVPTGTAGDSTIHVLVDSLKDITASFGIEDLDNDNDGMNDIWEAKYGLDTDRDDSLEDPDNDGLNNITEFEISYVMITNRSLSVTNASPINADSDGDGMDDGYEYKYILNNSTGGDGTNAVAGGGGLQFNALAVVNNGGVYGPDGNLDSDFLWSTNSGYEMSKIPLVDPLVNMLEYIGPDEEKPGDWSVAVVVPGVSELVHRYEPRVEDTGDQSRSDTTDSETYGGSATGDGFDDGFEYTWDRWQRLHAGEVSRVYVTTNGAVTNLVPAWTNIATRHFNPAILSTEDAQADNDLIYDPITCQVGDWLTDALEYNAWQDPTSPLLRTKYPDRKRSTNPFLWDTDGDHMPDGWEMAFGYDPWDTDTDNNGYADGNENPDYDWYANDGSNKHHTVYLVYGFDPRTGYWYNNYEPDSDKKIHTVQFSNYEELIGSRGYAAVIPNDPEDTVTNPFKVDTDDDGIWDGWEWYVGLNAKNKNDGIENIDNMKSFDVPPSPPEDGLSNFEEFNSLATSSTNFSALTHIVGWYNKTKPTDPWDWDTDGDQLSDSEERYEFNTGAASLEGGGLTPTDADTDGDHLPDAWEAVYAGVYDPNRTVTNIIYDNSDELMQTTVTNISHWIGGMSGNANDQWGDADGDGLLNYQEYMIGAVPMWQFQYNNGNPAWGGFVVSDDPFDWFDDEMSNGGYWDEGPGGRRPHVGDPHYEIGPEGMKIPWNFITAAVHENGLWFSTSDPTTDDSDFDDMDDYWEVFHGLDPLYGGFDVVRSKVYGLFMAVSSLDQNDSVISGVPDLRLYPWFSGLQWTDVDQDELPNIYESAQPNATVPYYHTDPSPAWITDTSSEQSWVNSQYTLGRMLHNSGDTNRWYWDPFVLYGDNYPPSYIYSFESEEGFDTDNDNLPDHAELVNDPISPGVTDPLESQAPIKRRALYLDGASAARVMAPVAHKDPSDLRTFTLESWVRPVNPASGSDQIILERSGLFPEGNYLSGSAITLRRNFVLGIDKDGLPYVGYNGGGENNIFVDIKAPSASALIAGQWVHLAATYDGEFQSDGQWIGVLSLFINGEMVASTLSSVIPQTDWYGSAGTGLSVGFIYPMAVTVGAGDINPVGWVDGASILNGAGAGEEHSQPDLHSRFTGWIDQIHVWNRAREDADIRSSMTHRYTRAEVAMLTTNVAVPQMRYIYSFDDLPDPDHSPVAPDGFSLLNGRPVGYISIPWWATAADKSMEYTDYMYVPWIDNLAGHGAGIPPLDTKSTVTRITTMNGETNTTTAVDYPNTSNPYSLNYFTSTRFSKEHHPHLSSPVSAYGSAFNFYPDLLPLGNAVADEDIVLWDGGGLGTDQYYDTDGDGMSDVWETKYGFDPNDAGDAGSPFDDPDQDGLINLYEYFAFKEYGIELNPGVFSTFANGTSDYYVLTGSNLLTLGEIYADTDLLPDIWEEKFVELNHYYYHRDQDPDNDGWDNQSEYLGGSSPTNILSIPMRRLSGTLIYDGSTYDPPETHFYVLAYNSATMDTMPVGATVTRVGNIIHYNFNRLPGNEVYLFAYATSQNAEGTTFTPGNAYGVVGPINVGFTDAVNIEIPVNLNNNTWFPTFEWTRPVDLDDVYVRIRDENNGSTLILSRWVHNNRNWLYSGSNYTHQTTTYFHKGDYLAATKYTDMNVDFGLPPGNYKWQVASNAVLPSAIFAEGMISVLNWPLPDIAILSPVNSTIIKHQVYPFTWHMEDNTRVSSFEIQYWDMPVTSIGNKIFEAPTRDDDGNYTIMMPLALDPQSLFGSGVFKNGAYQWRVRAVHGNTPPAGDAGWSDFKDFIVDVSSLANDPQSAAQISGNILYFGRSATTNIIVNAYTTLGYQNSVEGRLALTNASSFVMTGLHNKEYYLNAFIDLNDNHLPDEWEPQGIYRRPDYGGRYEYRADAYSVGMANLTNNNIFNGVSILIKDRDTNNDNVPDGWDWESRPAALQGDGFVALGSDSDSDSDGVSLFQEYGYGSDPYSSDSDGDGLSDGQEAALGTSLISNDSDGDTLLDAYEVAGAGLDPVNPDDDNDGIPTAIEVAWNDADGVGVYSAGSDMNPSNPDSDGDNISDLMEVAAGSNPMDGSDADEVSITSIVLGMTGELPVVGWDMHSNIKSLDIRYVLERSSNFLDWETVGEEISSGDKNISASISDTNTDIKGFYRLRISVK